MKDVLVKFLFDIKFFLIQTLSPIFVFVPDILQADCIAWVTGWVKISAAFVKNLEIQPKIV